MGKAAQCEASLDGRPVRITAHLDAAGLVLRGELALRLARSDIAGVRVVDDRALVIATPAGELALVLGRAANTWAQELQHPKSVVEK
ncbi:MAG: hypothetical protein IAI50_07840, partial [Candidatus Eremiobacteraeota bacterium]|nr:hypothetical protein [Candidatus Eremiobacteraeota bacterium]